MPGIVGLIAKTINPKAARRQLERMVASLQHEASYATGTWMDQEAGIYVGWALRQNSAAVEMPLFNEGKDIVLCFAGEEFPDPDLPAQLKQRGHRLAGGSSYLVHLYEENPFFFEQLNGTFQGLLLDQSRGSAMLFNDRFGLHRVYYHEGKDGFYFSPEAKAILAVCPELRRIDARGLGEFVACGCVLENRTLFPGVHVLPAGSVWKFQSGNLKEKEQYFNPRSWQEQETLSPEEFYKALRKAYADILPRYFDGGERVGMSLTGGLDTRMIMSWHKPAAGSLPCYSFGGPFRECNDVKLARRIAQACGQPYQVIKVGEDFLGKFEHYAQRTVYLSDACTNVSWSSSLYANERAAEIAPVRMTGNYGSEILRRGVAFEPRDPSEGIFGSDFLPHIHNTQQTYAALLGNHALSFIAFRQTPWHHYGLRALEQTQVTVRSPFLDNEIVRIAFRAPESAIPSDGIFQEDDVSLRLIAEGDSMLRQIRTDRGLAGPPGRLSGAWSRAWQEFTFKAEYAYDYGMPQWVAKLDHLASPLRLERLFLGKHKFSHFRVWYRDRLSRYVQEMLLDSRSLSRPYLNRSAVEGVVRSHIQGTRNYTVEIHNLLTLELLHRLFVDGN